MCGLHLIGMVCMDIKARISARLSYSVWEFETRRENVETSKTQLVLPNSNQKDTGMLPPIFWPYLILG